MFSRLLAVAAAGLWVTLAQPSAEAVTAVVDNTSYNAGATVRIRLQPANAAKASIRYAGGGSVATDIAIKAEHGYAPLWSIPRDAKAGRYEVDVTGTEGTVTRNAASF